jgi:hypothetical protein
MDIIDDYKCHFSKLDELIDWIVASRFLVDRKKAHLWLQCDSDWGKGMLFNELDKAGLLTKISVKEIEKAMSGNPVGKSARDFRRSLILWVDEFKNVKSELKEICSELTLSPKNQLSVTVPLYCKVFTSAEGVASLANDYGVEDQFANRFSYIKGENSIEVREMWQRVGSVVYGDNVISYIVHNINKKIDEMRILGRTEAALKSEKYIANYKKKYGIDKSFSRLSENIEVIASEISAYIYERLEFSKTTTWDGQQCYLSTPVRVVEDIMNELYTKSMMGTFRFKTNDIIQCLSVSGTGVKPKRLVIGGVSKTAKVLEVRRPETFNVFEEELEETIVTNLSDINTLKAA